MGELLTRASWQVGENKAYISSKLRLRWWLSCVSSFVEGVGWSWFDTARRLVDMDWYLYNTGRDIRLINGCGPTPESVRGSKGRNAQRRGFLSEDSCRSSERVSATIHTYIHTYKQAIYYNSVITIVIIKIHRDCCCCLLTNVT